MRKILIGLLITLSSCGSSYPTTIYKVRNIKDGTSYPARSYSGRSIGDSDVDEDGNNIVILGVLKNE